jgi:hypothetical protein
MVNHPSTARARRRGCRRRDGRPDRVRSGQRGNSGARKGPMPSQNFVKTAATDSEDHAYTVIPSCTIRAESSHMNSSYFTASRLGDGSSSWTLVTRLGQMLSRAENLYGPRDRSWTILGIEFGLVPPPMIWFPGDCKHIAIRLAPNALDNEVLACYQLAHECVHLLAPMGQANSPVLEEGVATAFAEDYVLSAFGSCPFLTDEPAYIRAAAVVRELLREAPDAISRLRAIEPCFQKITANVFGEAGLTVPRATIDELLSPFRMPAP